MKQLSGNRTWPESRRFLNIIKIKNKGDFFSDSIINKSMKENNQYQNWTKPELIAEIMRLKRGKNKPKKIKKVKENPKKIRRKIKKLKLKKIKKESKKINKIKNKPKKIGQKKIKPEEIVEISNESEREKFEQLNRWFLKAKEEHPGEIVNFEEFKDFLTKKRVPEKPVSVQEAPVKEKKEPDAQPKPIQETKKIEPVKTVEDKTMEKIRNDLGNISAGSSRKKSSESVLEKTIGLLNEGISDFKEEQQIRKIEKLKIKCRYKILVREYETVINKILKEFDEKHLLSKEIKNIVDNVQKNKSPNLQGLAEAQKEELSKFIQERTEYLRRKVNIWFKQLENRFHLTPEEFSLLAQLINNDFPYK
jgi:hypothetical protein